MDQDFQENTGHAWGSHGEDTGGWVEVGPEVVLAESDIPETTTSPDDLDFYSLDLSATPFNGQYLRLSFRETLALNLVVIMEKCNFLQFNFMESTRNLSATNQRGIASSCRSLGR